MFYRLQKNLRGIVKDCLPYRIQQRRAAKVYGLYYPDLATAHGISGLFQNFFFWIMPFGLVRKLKDLPKDGAEYALEKAESGWKFAPRYRFTMKKHRQFLLDRKNGLQLDRPLIERNKNCSVLVILHLFYDTAWPVISEYLENLSCYKVDWIFTVTEGCIREKTLRDMKTRYPTAKIIECENRGFDLWPFIKALESVDLKRYDVVYKLHSKGITRPNSARNAKRPQ